MEGTPKQYKVMQTAGVLSILLGVVLAAAASVNDTGGNAAAAFFWGGAIVYAAGRFIPWFKHG